MKKYILFLVISISCNTGKLKEEIKVKEKIIDSLQSVLTEKSMRKFVFIIVETDEPTLESEFTSYSYRPQYYAKSRILRYTSSIKEVANFNEDEKYRLLDEYEALISSQNFPIKNIALEKVRANCSIKKSQIYTYDTYESASIARRESSRYVF